MVRRSLRGISLVMVLVAADGGPEGASAPGVGPPAASRESRRQPQGSGGACVSSRDKWRSTRFSDQEGTFAVEFDVVAGEAPMNGITGLSFGPAEKFEDLAASVRFSPDGVIDSRNGSEFEARTRLSYRAGAPYHVRMVVRMRQRTYDVHVTPPGGAEQALALNHGFRTEQEDLDSLNHWALFAREGTHEVCRFSGPHAQPATGAPAEDITPAEAPPEPLAAPRPDATAVLVGAGDIGNCHTETDEATARVLDRIEGTVFTVGDNAYPDGSSKNFERCFEPNWGRHKDRMRPVPGNHEYNTPGAKAYFDYFGDRAGPRGRGYYSYNLGAWHVIALNSNIDMQETSGQVAWLRQDLAANPAKCTLAYWHHARFSSGSHGNSDKTKVLWKVLYEAGADVILSGHDHSYERFAPQTADGKADSRRGIRQFVVGMGGTELRKMNDRAANSEVRNSDTHGVLKLTLLPDRYRWEFVPAGAGTFTDAGTGTCH
jgi:3',5'-cyclic AMP phosphodiesterase CpdA